MSASAPRSPAVEAAASSADDGDYFGHARPEVAALVPTSARRIVDVGCGAGALGASLRRRPSRPEVRGIEMVTTQAEAAARVLDDAWNGSADDGLPSGWPTPDCLVFADVLEHLVDPWTTLRRWVDALAPGGAVVVSLPNVVHRSIATDLVVRSRFAYTDAGLLDRTHLRFFTPDSARAMLAGAGLTVQTFRRTIEQRSPSIVGRFAWLAATRLSRREERGAFVPAGARPLLDLMTYQMLLVGRKPPR